MKTFIEVGMVCLGIAMLAAPVLEAADVVASGLNNPRGIAAGPDGAIYVAEAGTGGSGPCAEGPEGFSCFGTSGSVTRIDLRTGAQSRVAVGFPSIAPPDGTFALGLHDISFQGLGNGFVTIGFGGHPANRAAFGPGGAILAHLARVIASGNWSVLKDLGAFEVSFNPTGDEVDSNPYGILALPGKQIVTDAGGNDLLEISADGKIRTLAVFANRLADAPPFLGLPPGTQIPMDAVPTTVVQGPDGDYYVGQLTGFPFPSGGANVYRVPAQGGIPTVAHSGFTNIIDITFGPDGSLYVLQISKNGLLSGDPTGALIRVRPDGTRTELAAGELIFPGGVTFGPDGALYVTNLAVLSGAGEVVRITP